MVHWFYGRVSGVKKTEKLHQGSPYFVPDDIQNISLTNPGGETRDFELTDFKAACDNEEWITVAWAVRKGADSGPCIALNNDTTQKTFASRRELTKILQPACLKPAYLTPIIVFGILTGGVFAPILLPILFLAGKVADRRVTRFIGSFAFAPAD